MNPEIENLINMALADGEVTEKERAIILRKAEALGEDKDEVEMILDGKIALMMKEQNANQQQAKPKSNKEGDIKKCPSCGAPVQSFATKCSVCGHEFRNIKSSNSVNNLVSKLEKAEEKVRLEEAEEKVRNKIGGFMKWIDSNADLKWNEKIFNAKSNVINSFPIPNTKEDIFEFLALGVAQVNSIKIGVLDRLLGSGGTNYYEITYKNAWLSLANRVVLKARFSMKEDKKALEEIEIYAKQLKIK